jgi:glycosyltransferase involved in cell wall biosynthesis
MTNKNNPLVSIIVPSYNYGRYMEQCLNSIHSQTYNNLELIIVDDCSQDNSVQIITDIISDKTFQAKFENRITFIQHERNLGAHSTINEGLGMVNGVYLTIINADDLYEPNRFEVMIQELLRNNSRIAFSKIKVIDENGINVNETNEEARRFAGIQELINQYPTVGFALIPQNIAISTGNLIFERALYLEVGGFRSLKYCHDWDFILRCVLITEPIFIKTTHYCYRLHENNSFRSLGKVVKREVGIVLGSFFNAIRHKKYSNSVAPSPINFPNEFRVHVAKTYYSKFWNRSYAFKLYYLLFQQYIIDRFASK